MNLGGARRSGRGWIWSKHTVCIYESPNELKYYINLKREQFLKCGFLCLTKKYNLKIIITRWKEPELAFGILKVRHCSPHRKHLYKYIMCGTFSYVIRGYQVGDMVDSVPDIYLASNYLDWWTGPAARLLGFFSIQQQMKTKSSQW